MKKLQMLTILFLLMSFNLLAKDNTPDYSGYFVPDEASQSGIASLDVRSATDSHAIRGSSSGVAAAGVVGENITFGHYGILGGFHNTDEVGVYGYSLFGYAGYFNGDARITGNLVVNGTLTSTSLDGMYVNEGQVNSISGGMIANGAVNDSKITGPIGSGKLMEADPKIGSLNEGKWCISTSGKIDCTENIPGDGFVDLDWTISGSHIYSTVPGNVGIGTSNPTQKLEIDNGNVFIKGTDGFDAEGENASLFLGDGLNYVSARYGEGLRMGSGFGLLSIGFLGNVGIGIPTPPARLSVNSSAADGAGEYADGIVFTNNSYLPENGPWTHAGIWSDGSALFKGDLVFGTDGDGLRNTSGVAERMRIDSNGNVGIGTAPSERLTVAGTIESTSGGVKFPDGSIKTSARYGGVAVVAKSGGDYSDPRTALANYNVWCGIPSATNRCLLKIMPGDYDMDRNALYMVSHIDMEGSGENTTTITSRNSNTFKDGNSVTIFGDDKMEIRFITIENRGGGNYSIAIFNDNTSPVLTHVTVSAKGARRVVSGYSENIGLYNYGFYNYGSPPTLSNVTVTADSAGDVASIGIYNEYSSPILTDVTVAASGGGTSIGISNQDRSSPVMTNVTTTANGASFANKGLLNASYCRPYLTNIVASASGSESMGIDNESDGHVRIRNSSITGGKYSIYNHFKSATVRVAVTMLDGPVTDKGFTCIGSFRWDFSSLNSACK